MGRLKNLIIANEDLHEDSGSTEISICLKKKAFVPLFSPFYTYDADLKTVSSVPV